MPSGKRATNAVEARQKTTVKTEVIELNGTDQEKMTTLRADLDKVKKQLTCLICHELLFEPCNLPCGHVFVSGNSSIAVHVTNH